MMSLRRERAMQRDDVRLGNQFVRRHILAQRPAGVVLNNVIEQDSAAEAGENAGGDRAYLAGANHADRLAVHVEAEEVLDREVALADTVVRLVEFAIEAEH